MSDPRDRILAIVSKACFGSDDPCDVCAQRADAVMAVVQPALDERDAEMERLRAHILDIDAHATPYGDIPTDPGYTGVYLLTAGALHRALGTIGHTAPSCQAEAAIARAKELARRWRLTRSRVNRACARDLEAALDQHGDQEGSGT